MRSPDILTTRLVALIVINAAGAGLAAPSVLVTRPVSRLSGDWLPMDNQTLYTLEEGEIRNLELNTSSISQAAVYITVSPCSRHLHWAFYKGPSGSNEKQLQLIEEHGGGEMHTISFQIFKQERYVLQLSSSKASAAAVSVRGEATRHVRMRLRTRSKRRLSANWDPSPIDPQSTSYCVVASRRKNYTSLCAAQHDLRNTKTEKDRHTDQSYENRPKPNRSQASSSEENRVEMDTDSMSIFEGNFKTLYRKKKFGRSTRVSNEDPAIVCIGDRTHHFIENLDPSTTYFVSIFGIARDRRMGSLLATGNVRPRTSTAKRLRENIPYRADIKGKNVYYLKTTAGSSSTAGLWLAASTCGGSVDIEVSVRGKRLYVGKNIETHSKFFVTAPISSSVQETSDEGSVQFDSSSEESKIRYVIRVVPNKWVIDGAVTLELTASTSRWGMSSPELIDGGDVRELRPRRSCRSVDVAFLPATHNATDVIRYCILTKEIIDNDNFICALKKKSSTKTQCISHMQRPQSRVIVQKVIGLKPGRKYVMQVTAASKGSSVPYNALYADTNTTCKEE